MASACELPPGFVRRHAVCPGEHSDGLPSELLGEREPLERRERRSGAALIRAQGLGNVREHVESIPSRAFRLARRRANRDRLAWEFRGESERVEQITLSSNTPGSSNTLIFWLREVAAMRQAA